MYLQHIQALQAERIHGQPPDTLRGWRASAAWVAGLTETALYPSLAQMHLHISKTIDIVHVCPANIRCTGER